LRFLHFVDVYTVMSLYYPLHVTKFLEFIEQTRYIYWYSL